MTDSSVQPDRIEQEQEQLGERLKYLDFVQVAVMQMVVCLSSMYFFAKDNAGPLKPGVQSVEGTVKAIVSPIYEKFHGVPLEILKYADRKVEEVSNEVERHVPSMLKKVSKEAYTAAHSASEVARSVAEEVQRSGLGKTVVGIARAAKNRVGPVAVEFYGRYEPVVERYTVVAWRSLNQLPIFPQVAQIIVPTALYWTEKYNHAVGYAAEKGYVVGEFLPLVPTEKIAKVFDSECGVPSVSGTALLQDNTVVADQ